MPKFSSLLVATLLMGCQSSILIPKNPPPIPPPDTDLCGQMCQHLSDLNCEEGKPLYNSDLPGPEGVPNQDCKSWCEEIQDRGVFINPRCVTLAPNCSMIEQYRDKAPDTCVPK